MKECFILGGGQSLAEYDIASIKDDIIAVNYSLRLRPDAKYFVGLDTKIHIDLKEELENYNGAIFYDRLIKRYDKANYIWIKQTSVFSQFFPYVYAENNSGIAAINIAYLLGYRKINLVGFDFYGENNFTKAEDEYFERVNKKAERILRNYKKYLVNCNPNSNFLK